jgi:hypothetical protein
VHERYPFDVGSEKKLLNCAIAATGKRLILFGAYAGADGEPTTRDGQSGVYCLAFDGERFLPYSFFPFSSLRSDVSFSKRSSNIHAYAYFLAQNDSLLLFATDFYSPEYAYPSQPDYSMLSFYGVPGYTTQARFIGYRYTVGCLFTCNAEGEIIRNNYFNYNGLILKSVTELLQAYIDPDSADVLVYFSTAGKLYSLIFNNDRIIQNIQTQTIEPLGQYQVVSANELSACRHWYKNYFTCYGYQTVSNRVRSSRKSDRRVFYVNKLVFD